MILVKRETESEEEFLKRHQEISSNNKSGNRDFQKSKVYKSEKLMRFHIKNRFKNIPVMDEWVKENIIPFTSHYFGINEIVIGDGSGCRSALASHDRKSISMPRWSRKDWVLLHEIAHLPTTDHHGPTFCAVYLRLIREFISEEAEQALTQRFIKNGVKYIDPDNHEVIFEQTKRT